MLMDNETEQALRHFMQHDYVEVHCFVRWTIFRCVPRMEKTVKELLLKAGFEAWYPKGTRYSMRPLRQLPSKTRHRRRFEVVEREVAAIPGYVLARHMISRPVAFNLDDLPGLLGVCVFGDHIAYVSDLEVEKLRTQEERGEFDIYTSDQARVQHGQQQRYKVGQDREKQWTGQSRIHGRGCESGHLVTFAETLGRITKVISLKELARKPS